MNYLMLLVGAHLALTNFNSSDIKLDQAEWSRHKIEFGKSYSPSEDALRSLIFAANKLEVEEFNAKQSQEAGFTLGLNHLADLSSLEVKKMNGYKAPRDISLLGENSPEANKFLNTIYNDHSIKVPDALDWRNVTGRVSPVKNQGFCGSCWAFATTGVLEGQEVVRNSSHKLTELSEQNLVDCVKKADGCGGGWPEWALDYARGGVDSEASYPYVGSESYGGCKFNKDKVTFKDAGHANLPRGDEQKLKEVVAKFGPVAIAVDASSKWFQLYKGGVYYVIDCKSAHDELDHAMLVVGYGRDKYQGDYWLVKNSWGSSYGESGYIRMARNRGNNCGIATAATIPIF